MAAKRAFVLLSLLPFLASAQKNLDACPGYKATGVSVGPAGLTANLELAGPACNVYGSDIQKLSLSVEYETGE